MKIQLNRKGRVSLPLFTATLALAIAFTSTACDSGGGGGGGGGGSNIEYGSLQYQGLTYKTVKIDKRTWMAENLNYNTSSSKCYNNEPANCNKYGRLYNWATAKIVCPVGWHLPSEEEWEALYHFADGSEECNDFYYCESKYLKAKSGWNDYDTSCDEIGYNCKGVMQSGNGTDKFGFAALPGGSTVFRGDGMGGGSYSAFGGAGDYGYWWSSSEYDSYAVYLKIDKKRLGFYDLNKSAWLSVRCIQD
jgi:uncharacterized protein (TIGR02145 family)